MSDLITPVWPQVEPLVAIGLRGCPTHDPGDLRWLLVNGQCQLWVQRSDDDGVIEAAIVTQLAGYPRGVWVRVWLDGCLPGRRQDHQGFLRILAAFRGEQQARGFECVGRLGFARLFPQAAVEGFVLRWTEQQEHDA